MTVDTDRNAVDEREVEFVASVRAGRKIQAWDWMPAAYRDAVVRMVGQQAVAEIVGSTMFSEVLDAAPTLERKAMLLAKVQDEIGHGHVCLRVCEDLGKSREEIMEDYFAGRIHLLNTFHYEFRNWPEIGPVRVLMTGAAAVQFASLVNTSYQPYARALKKILQEESFHYHEACDLTLSLRAANNPEHLAQMQAGIDEWYPRMLAYFGPPDAQSRHSAQLQEYGLKVNSNDEMRQLWLTKVVSLLRGWGFSIPDDRLEEVEPGKWDYTRPDWAETRSLLKDGGPCSQRRLEHAMRYYRGSDWIRTALDAAAPVPVSQ
jgi:ring-1,2-phenylacetyl-CoA epoxidase subunit PaaA